MPEGGVEVDELILIHTHTHTHTHTHKIIKIDKRVLRVYITHIYSFVSLYTIYSHLIVTTPIVNIGLPRCH